MTDCFNKRIYCPLCHENFDEDLRTPRILRACGHTFCQKCIKYHFKNTYMSNCHSLVCPLCHSESELPLLWNSFIDIFPKNYFCVDLIKFYDHKVTCKHTAEKAKFICFQRYCCQRTPFCIICYEECHFDCDRSLIIKAKDIGVKTIFQIDQKPYQELIQLIVKVSQVSVTSNHAFLEGLVELVLNDIKRIQALISKTHTSLEFTGHLFFCEFDQKQDKIFCDLQNSIVEKAVQDLKDLYSEAPFLSSLQFLFQLFIITFRTVFQLDNKSIGLFKNLTVDIQSLESVAVKKTMFSEYKFNPEYSKFKEFYHNLFQKLNFKDFARESISFEKNLTQELETKKNELKGLNEKRKEIESQLKDSFVVLEEIIGKNFICIPDKLIIAGDDFYNFRENHGGNQRRPINESKKLHELLQQQMLNAEYYLNSEEVENINKTLIYVRPELAEIIQSLLEDVSKEQVYDTKKKATELKNIGVFVYKVAGNVSLNSYFIRKIRSSHLSEIRGYLKEYNEEIQFKITRAMMKNIVITQTLSIKDEINLILNSKKHTFSSELIRIIDQSPLYQLSKIGRQEMMDANLSILKEKKVQLENYCLINDEKNLLESKTDKIEDKITFELLALEFFCLIKSN